MQSMKENQTDKAVQQKKLSLRLLARLPRFYAITTALVVIFIAGFLFGRGVALNPGQAANLKGGTVTHTQDEIPSHLLKDTDFRQFWQVWDYVKNNYVKSEIPETQLFYGAVEGIVGSLKDPYSVFLPPVDSQKFEEELSGSFEGIGAEIGFEDSQLIIVAPLPGNPAEKAGLHAGDYILEINGENTAGLRAPQ